jgi:hypothetical protein
MDAALKAEIRTELTAIGASAPVLMTRAGTSKLYEIFILAGLVRALRGLNATLIPKNSAGQHTNNLVFRLGPGTLSAPQSAPGYIHVTLQGGEYEIQNGLRVAGRSKVLHELDVCLIDRSEAMKCRRNGNDPTYRMIKFIAECKCYGARVELSLGREYLGLSSEFPMKRGKTMASNVSSEEVHDLVTRHDGTENFDLSPLLPRNLDRFVKWLENELRQILL